jgi:hypothetical protein
MAAGEASMGQAFASENRIALAQLPPGDLLLDVDLGIAGGGGAVGMRLHVGP